MGKAGKDFLLKVNTEASTYVTLGGLRSAEFELTREAIDVTNHGSNQNKESLSGAGIKSMSLSGSGVFEDGATYDVVEDAYFDQTHLNFQIVDADSGKTYQGAFAVTSLSRTGAFDGAQEFSISLESSGAITRS